MKISIIVDGKFHTKNIEIPDGTPSEKRYIENIYNSMRIIDTEFLEGFLYQDNSSTVFYGNPSLNISVWTEFHNLIAILDNPDFLKYHTEFNNTSMKFEKSPLMKLYSFEEFLPFDTATHVKKFLNFVVNTIKVGFNMDDLMLNPVISITNSNGKILDSSGRTIPIDKFLQDYLTRMIDYCKSYLGNAEFANFVKSMVDMPEPGQPEPVESIAIPSELKNHLIDLHSAWVMIINELNGDIPNSDKVHDLFTYDYRFSRSFDEFGIDKWYTAITGNKVPEVSSPANQDLSGYIKAYINSIKAIDDFMDSIYKTHPDYDIIEAKFYNQSYPFDNYEIDEVAMIVEHWGNGLISNLEDTNVITRQDIIKKLTETFGEPFSNNSDWGGALVFPLDFSNFEGLFVAIFDDEVVLLERYWNSSDEEYEDNIISEYSIDSITKKEFESLISEASEIKNN